MPECAVQAMHKYELDQFRLSTNIIVPKHPLYKCHLGELKLKSYSRKRRIVLRTVRWTREGRGIECQRSEMSNRQRWWGTLVLLCQ